MKTGDQTRLQATSAEPDQLATLLLGAEAWNDWRKKQPDVQVDLSGLSMPEADLVMVNFGGANLRGADLHGADMSGANMNGADLGGTNLRGASLRGADLSWAYLSDSNLTGADLSEALLADANLTEANLARADLSNAELHGADLTGADLSSAQLDGANLEQAKLAGTRLSDLDLSPVKGLAQARHAGPSSIGIDTLYRSNGNIPDVFLRGAGVPENLIQLFAGLPPRRAQNLTCFIAHSYKDKRFCDRLYIDLQAYGVRTWYFPDDLPTGKRFLAEIVVRIKLFDKVIAVCSRNSLQNPKFVEELSRALKREQEEERQVLFPIRLDNFMLKEWEHREKRAVIDRVVADFRGWTRTVPKYEAAFKTLLGALKFT